MLDSKKVKMSSLGATLITVAAVLIPVLLDGKADAETIQSIVQTVAWSLGVIFTGYNVGQGLADFGKEGSAIDLDLTQQLAEVVRATTIQQAHERASWDRPDIPMGS